MKEEKDAAKEAFDATALAQFLFGPGGRQAGAVLLTLGVPGDDRDRSEGGMDPSDEAQPPIGRIQADHPRADRIQAHRPLQQATCERGIMLVGWREQKEKRQARAAAEQGMHAIAAQKGTGMLSGSMTEGRIRVSPSPGQDGRAIDDQITRPDEPTAHSGEHGQNEEGFRQRRSGPLSALALLR